MSLDDLTFKKQIGKGAFSEVYLTSKKNENSYYATKIINKSDFLKNPNSMEYLINEQSILKDVNHPNISKIIEVRETKEKLYIITEYYNGGTLRDFLKIYQEKNNKALSEEIVQYIMRQIIDGLNYLHNKKIIFRDVKLENMMLHYEDENDRINNNIMKAKIKIIDFGFAKHLKKGELTNSIVGAPFSMEPIMIFKLFSNNQEYKDYEYDEKVDIWSLGILFYELLTGKVPFEADDLEELVDKLKKGDYIIPATLSEEAFKFLTDMLQFESSKRPSIDILYNYEFLRKNVNQFKKINENLKDNSEIKMNIKNNN